MVNWIEFLAVYVCAHIPWVSAAEVCVKVVS